MPTGVCHTHLGKNVYANFNLTLVDDTDIYVGDSVMFAPNVVGSDRRTSDKPGAAPSCRAVQSSGTYRKQCLDRSRRGYSAGGYNRRQFGNRRGQCRDSRHTGNVVAVGDPCRVMREIGNMTGNTITVI